MANIYSAIGISTKTKDFLSFCVYPELSWDCIFTCCKYICVFQTLGQAHPEDATQLHTPSKNVARPPLSPSGLKEGKQGADCVKGAESQQGHQLGARKKTKMLDEGLFAVKHIIQEEHEVSTSARTETMALVEKKLEHLARLKTTETEIHLSETERQAKIEELWKQSRATEEKWLTKQQDWLNKASGMEKDDLAKY